MEWAIGNLGQEIRQPLRPYTNLSREGVRCCQVNALLAIMPELNESKVSLPTTATDLGDGFALLHKRNKYLISPEPEIFTAIQDYPRLPPCWSECATYFQVGATEVTEWTDSLITMA